MSTRKDALPLLFALGSDGEVYAVTPAHGAPQALRRDPALLLAVRLTRAERVELLTAVEPALTNLARELVGEVKPRKQGAPV